MLQKQLSYSLYYVYSCLHWLRILQKKKEIKTKKNLFY